MVKTVVPGCYLAGLMVNPGDQDVIGQICWITPQNRNRSGVHKELRISGNQSVNLDPMSDVPTIAIGGINIPKSDREGTYASVVDNPAINLRLANMLFSTFLPKTQRHNLFRTYARVI